MTSGPGDKSSPRLDEPGERLAYVVDGYVVEKDLNTGTLERRTTKDFGAQEIFWSASGKGQLVLAPETPENKLASSSEKPSGPLDLFKTQAEQNDLGVEPISTNILSSSRLPGSGNILAAFANGDQSKLANLGEAGEVNRFYTEPIDGDIIGISPSQSGNRALLTAHESNETTLYSFSLENGAARDVAHIKESGGDGKEVLGMARKTREGIYYIAGESVPADDTPVYDLYHLPVGAGPEEQPQIVSDVGEDFIPSDIQVSPEGDRLAILGRRSLNSPTNLYVLELSSGDLLTATSNESLEIKTGPNDLSWSNDGKSVVIVARADPSEIEIHPVPADALTADFYNVYEVPVDSLGGIG